MQSERKCENDQYLSIKTKLYLGASYEVAGGLLGLYAIKFLEFVIPHLGV